jgi:cardiolipin synthase A/B
MVSYKLLPNAQAFLDDLEREIKKARTRIDMQFFTFEADSVGKRIAKSLFDAKRRGVEVRFIVDHFIDILHNDYVIHKPRLNRTLQRIITGEWKDTKKLLEKMQEYGIEVRRTNPLGFLWRKIFQRNHKKMVIIDSNNPKTETAYIGGCNLSEHNVSWNDFMVKMKGDMIPILQNDFDATWENRNLNAKIEYGDGVVLLDSPQGDHEIMPFVIDLINNSKKRVIIESPYLRGSNLWKSLIEASRHGVGVHVIIPLHNNRKRLGAPPGKALKKLVENGGHVYRFKENKGMTHVKALLVDDLAMFGSSNLSESLAKRLTEVNIATRNVDMVKQLQKKLYEDIKMSVLQEV